MRLVEQPVKAFAVPAKANVERTHQGLSDAAKRTTETPSTRPSSIREISDAETCALAPTSTWRHRRFSRSARNE